ncbi:hypothetical protein EDB85DRAFT_121234 [Lactarius pseudohatsudake]|nr:hypothetical protein EDB85DRAFT_121234 [Lactarius pseudohatsudake]
MAEYGSSWTPVLLFDTSAVGFVGDWSAYTQGGFCNVRPPETNASVAYTFHGGFPFPFIPQWCSTSTCSFLGTLARAVGFVAFGPGDDLLQARITWGSEGSTEVNIPPSVTLAYCIGDNPSNHYNADTEMCPPAFYTTRPALPCNQYTVNFTVMPRPGDEAQTVRILPVHIRW